MRKSWGALRRSVLRGQAGSFERIVERAHNARRPPLSNKPLRIGARAVALERVRVVGGCVALVAGSCAHLCSVGKGADVSRSQTFHPLPLAQTMPSESTLQLVVVATHNSTSTAISMRVMPPPSPLSGPGRNSFSAESFGDR